MNGEPRPPGALRPISSSAGSVSSATQGPVSGDNIRSRNKRRDDAIRKKVEQELSRRTVKRNSTSSLSAQKMMPAAQLMAAKRTDAVLVVGEDGALAGILTDKDIAYRVVAEGLDIRTTAVNSVMTRDPISVYDKGSRNEALNIMVSRRFRHLPVISESNAGGDDDNADDENEFEEGGGGTSVVGLLDITRCVFERIDDLERKVNEDLNIISAMEVLERRGTVAAEHVGAVRQQHGCPDIGFVLTQTTGDNMDYGLVPEVSIKSSVRDAARVMKAHHSTAVLVVGNSTEDDKIGGIFTTKDIVLRVIAASLDPITTSVVRVMTPHPDFVLTETSILDALKKLHAGHYLHLPVVEGGVPVGLVDVMTLTISMLTYLMTKDTGAQDGHVVEDGPLWNRFWNSTFAGSNVETESDRHSQTSDSRPHGSSVSQQHTPSMQGGDLANRQPPLYHTVMSPQPDEYASMLTRSQVYTEDTSMFAFKLKDMTRGGNGKVFRFSSRANSLSELYSQVCLKTGAKSRMSDGYSSGSLAHNTRSDHLNLETMFGDVVRICYVDDEEDAVYLESDNDLDEAVSMARRLGWTRLMIYLGDPPVNDGASVSQVSSRAAPSDVERGASRSNTYRNDEYRSGTPDRSRMDVVSASNHPITVYNPSNDPHNRAPPTGIVDYLKDAPLPVNIAISAGIIVIAAYLIMKLQR
ncbi:hypothetical protein BASA84_001107 [Batrachochytrium salamandrivorans]|nr:hypothetical protein BASA84_001107 [Batrachochytrium salamandrivorans]